MYKIFGHFLIKDESRIQLYLTYDNEIRGDYNRHLSICGYFYKEDYSFIKNLFRDKPMTMITVSVNDVIPANIETVYAVIADYEVGHQAILPKPAFQEMVVIEGGYGAGTRLKTHVRIWGQSYFYEQVVEEPVIGRVIVERDVNSGQFSTFTLQPLSDTSTVVTITSQIPINKGFKGFLERISQTIISRLFKQELKNLADYVSRPVVASQDI